MDEQKEKILSIFRGFGISEDTLWNVIWTLAKALAEEKMHGKYEESGAIKEKTAVIVSEFCAENFEKQQRS